MTANHERAFIRHPADIPLDVSPVSLPAAPGAIRNLSTGGLAFSSPRSYPLGGDVNLVIRCCPQALEICGQVVWCEPRDGEYEVGIAFYGPNDAYQVRMVEQICQIEKYRREVFNREGRLLSQEQAAREWIDRYADDFAQSGGSD